MTNPIFWDGVLRGGAAALLLLLVCNFARDWRGGLAPRFGLLLTLGGVSYLTLPLMNAGLAGGWQVLPPHIMSLASPALFWLFAASWFDDDFELRPVHGGAVLLLVGAGLVSNYVWVARGGILLPLAWRSLSLVFVAMGVRIALQGRNNDLVEGRRRMRLALSIAIALLILWIVGSEVTTRGWPPPVAWRLANAMAVLLLAATVAFSLFGWRDPALLAPPVRAGAAVAAPEADDSALLARLQASMARERTYRQEGLTITAVAAGLGVPEYRLRRAINRGLGARNFNAYLNGFRLAEAEQALADPAQKEVPILTIALDAGFGSLAPFNRAFRAANDCTPSEYRAQKLRD
nr:AraC family transcriptional regulator [Polymorphobacter sp.]